MAAMDRLREPARLYPLVAIAGLALYWFANSRNPLLNDDGVLYLLVAKNISTHGLTAGFELYDRPFYSLFIAALHEYLGIGLVAAAHMINAVLCCMIVLAFTHLARLLYRDPSVAPWAALLILMHPKLNNYFAFVIRDLGYWAFLLGSFCALLRFVDCDRWRYAIAWVALTAVAAFFKPEALIFGAVLPLGLLFEARHGALKRALRVAALYALLLALLGLVAYLFAKGPEDLLERFLLIPQLPLDILRATTDSFETARQSYAELVLDPYSTDVAAVSLLGGLLTILFVKILNTLGPAQVLTIAYGARNAPIAPPGPGRALYLTMVIVGLAMLILFLAYRRFLDTRYVMILFFLAMLPVARTLQHLRAARFARSRIFPLVVLLVLALDLWLGLNKPKPYMLECVEWMESNIAPTTRIFSNDKQLAHHSGAGYDWNQTLTAGDLIAGGEAPVDGVDYWLIHLRGERDPLATPLRSYQARMKTIRQCRGKRGETVTVYAPIKVEQDRPPRATD